MEVEAAEQKKKGLFKKVSKSLKKAKKSLRKSLSKKSLTGLAKNSFSGRSSETVSLYGDPPETARAATDRQRSEFSIRRSFSESDTYPRDRSRETPFLQEFGGKEANVSSRKLGSLRYESSEGKATTTTGSEADTLESTVDSPQATTGSPTSNLLLQSVDSATPATPTAASPWADSITPGAVPISLLEERRRSSAESKGRSSFSEEAREILEPSEILEHIVVSAPESEAKPLAAKVVQDSVSSVESGVGVMAKVDSVLPALKDAPEAVEPAVVEATDLVKEYQEQDKDDEVASTEVVDIEVQETEHTVDATETFDDEKVAETPAEDCEVVDIEVQETEGSVDAAETFEVEKVAESQAESCEVVDIEVQQIEDSIDAKTFEDEKVAETEGCEVVDIEVQETEDPVDTETFEEEKVVETPAEDCEVVDIKVQETEDPVDAETFEEEKVVETEGCEVVNIKVQETEASVDEKTFEDEKVAATQAEDCEGNLAVCEESDTVVDTMSSETSPVVPVMSGELETVVEVPAAEVEEPETTQQFFSRMGKEYTIRDIASKPPMQVGDADNTVREAEETSEVDEAEKEEVAPSMPITEDAAEEAPLEVSTPAPVAEKVDEEEIAQQEPNTAAPLQTAVFKAMALDTCLAQEVTAKAVKNALEAVQKEVGSMKDPAPEEISEIVKEVDVAAEIPASVDVPEAISEEIVENVDPAPIVEEEPLQSVEEDAVESTQAHVVADAASAPAEEAGVAQTDAVALPDEVAVDRGMEAALPEAVPSAVDQKDAVAPPEEVIAAEENVVDESDVAAKGAEPETEDTAPADFVEDSDDESFVKESELDVIPEGSPLEQAAAEVLDEAPSVEETNKSAPEPEAVMEHFMDRGAPSDAVPTDDEEALGVEVKSKQTREFSLADVEAAKAKRHSCSEADEASRVCAAPTGAARHSSADVGDFQIEEGPVVGGREGARKRWRWVRRVVAPVTVLTGAVLIGISKI